MRLGPPCVIGLIVGWMPLVATPEAEAQCRPKQVSSARKLLHNLSCVQEEFSPGPVGPPGPPGPPGATGLQGEPGGTRLDYVSSAILLAPQTFDCAAAECAAGDRIINCDSANFNPSTENLDSNTVLISAIGFRDPEDDTSDDVLRSDTCLACYSNFNQLTAVRILSRAVCAVGAKGRAVGSANGDAHDKPGYAALRKLSAALVNRAVSRP